MSTDELDTWVARIKALIPKETSFAQAEQVLKGAQVALQHLAPLRPGDPAEARRKQSTEVVIHFAEQLAYAKAQYATLEDDVALLRAAPHHTTETAKRWRSALNGLWLIKPSKITVQADFWHALETHFPEGAMKLMSPDAAVQVWRGLTREALLGEIQALAEKQKSGYTSPRAALMMAREAIDGGDISFLEKARAMDFRVLYYPEKLGGAGVETILAYTIRRIVECHEQDQNGDHFQYMFGPVVGAMSKFINQLDIAELNEADAAIAKPYVSKMRDALKASCLTLCPIEKKHAYGLLPSLVQTFIMAYGTGWFVQGATEHPEQIRKRQPFAQLCHTAEMQLPFPIRDILEAAKEDAGVSDYHANLVLDLLQASILHAMLPTAPLDPHRMGRDTCYNLYLRQCFRDAEQQEPSVYYEGATTLAEWLHDHYTTKHHPSGASRGVLDSLMVETWPMSPDTKCK